MQELRLKLLQVDESNAVDKKRASINACYAALKILNDWLLENAMDTHLTMEQFEECKNIFYKKISFIAESSMDLYQFEEKYSNLQSNSSVKIHTDQLQSLTRREKEVFEHITMGKTYKQISSALYIAQGTVKKHIENIYSKLGVSCRFELFKKLEENSTN